MEPGVIKKLEKEVINRIAAGEIIQRPANALKELIENSLDAKATFVQIVIKGLKYFQIQDNGTGIRRDSLAIVCERFATSKLTKFEDLPSLNTYGFRGEALASISHIAHVSIQTKTAQDPCGYKAVYENGKLKEPPKPCAANQGTIVVVEDLFYNTPQRQQSIKSSAEEYQKICDVVTKYAVHNYKIVFLLKKFGEQPTLKTTPNATQEDIIRSIYGPQIANNLLQVEMENNKYCKFSMKGHITKVNYSAKKGIFILFINARLVQNTGLKAAVESVYSVYLPKGSHPFVYISIELEPSKIDVNVHPTKHEVHFLYEKEIIEMVKAQVEMQLLGSNSTRAFYKQLKLPGATDVETTTKPPIIDKIYEKDLVRTDAKEQKLEKFLGMPGNITKMPKTDTSFRSTNTSTSTAKIRKEVRLTSVLNMRKRVEKDCSLQLRRIFKEMVFVGVVDKTFSLLQYEKALYLCKTSKICEELFYQRLIYDFQNFSNIKLEPKLSIKQLLRLSLDSNDSGWTEDDGDKDELADQATSNLMKKAPIMREYFGLHINDHGELECLPILLPHYYACSAFLPNYLLNLATKVDWDIEENCFQTFCRETAYFYSRVSALEFQSQAKKQKWIVEYVLFPAFKRYLLPSDKLKSCLYELTNLPKLYKVFERC